MPASEQHSEALQYLAERIVQAGLRVPITIALDIVKPLDFLSSQVVLFVRPFTTGSSFERYAAVLIDESSWKELRDCLARQKG